MKIGQTSLVVFGSKLAGAVLGFASTIYFARVLGAEVIGIYAVVIAVLSWLKMGGRAGINQAIKKRISEERNQGQHLTAGIVLMMSLLVVLMIGVFFARAHVENYVSGFEEYSPVSVVWFLIGILTIHMATIPVKSTLHGQRLVYIAGLLNPLQIAAQSLIQIALVFLGFSLVGMLVGHAAAVMIVGAIGLIFVSVRPRWPEWRHFRSLLDYAKFAWLGSLKTRAFNDVDILILGALVPQALVGVYSVVWTLTTFFDQFGTAISQAMFPEISNLSAQDSQGAATDLIEDGLTYAGLIVIPGVVGGVLLDDRLLRIYGGEFVQGTNVFWLLLISILFYSYMKQHLNALNALDRPDLTFRINSIFILSNITFNILLIWQMGWVGAAIASAISSGIGLVLSHVSLTRVVTIELPFREVSRQVFASLGMGTVVWTLRRIVETTSVIEHNFLIVLGLVVIGIGVYLILLLTISPEFRATVDRNIPVDLSCRNIF